MVYWCETTEKEKTQAVQDAKARDVQLCSEIEERAVRFGQLSASIDQTKQKIAANIESLNQATQLREKEASEFSQGGKGQRASRHESPKRRHGLVEAPVHAAAERGARRADASLAP